MRREMLKQFIRKPVMTGSIWPSSPFLSRRILDSDKIRKAKKIVELGPGTGAVTQHILRSLTPDSKFFTVELNSEMIPAFQRHFPNVKIYNESAAKLPELIRAEGMEFVDAVISGLPWASLSGELQDELLDSIVASLPAGGYFTTYGYVQGTLLPGAKTFRKRLDRHFSKVKKSSVIWLNLPPAFVYRCVK